MNNITIAEFKERKKELEKKLVSMCSKEVQEFKKETGITVTNIFFDFVYIQEMSKEDSNYILSSCSIGTNIDA